LASFRPLVDSGHANSFSSRTLPLSQDNQICTLRGSLLEFKFLETLDLANNQLRDLSKQVCLGRRLRSSEYKKPNHFLLPLIETLVAPEQLFGPSSNACVDRSCSCLHNSRRF
jgi:Leucine-rich repeat (LRR) protein